MSGSVVLEIDSLSSDEVKILPRSVYENAHTLRFQRSSTSTLTGSSSSNGNEVDNVMVDIVLEALTNNTSFPSLKKVLLYGINIKKKLFDDFCQYLSSRSVFCHWNSLAFVRCHLSSIACHQLLQAATGNPLIEGINISGNNLGDDIMSSVALVVTHADGRLACLELCGNALTATGLSSLCDTLLSPNCRLRTLFLSNNVDLFLRVPGYPSEDYLGADKLFSTLTLPWVSLTDLSLSGCQLSEGQWSRYLPFLTSLQSLDLSHNLLDDGCLVQLCLTLEHCPSLIGIDLSYNYFLGSKCTILEQLLSNNQSLHSLSLAGNRFQTDAVFSAIVDGLIVNKALLTLDLSDCGMSHKVAKDFGRAFQSNAWVTLKVNNNSLPPPMIQDLRMHFHGIEEQRYQPLATDSCWKALEMAQKWREQEIKTVSLSLSSQTEPQQSGLSTYDTTKNNTLYERCLYQWNLIRNSSYYYSEEELRRFVQDAEKAHAATAVPVEVTLGRRDGLSLGHIKIHALTTYAQARGNILPLMELYLQSADGGARGEFCEFSIIDPRGLPVPAVDSKRRKVWSEIWDDPRPCVVVRPSNWMSLSQGVDPEEVEVLPEGIELI
eukprot:gene9496-10492_t